MRTLKRKITSDSVMEEIKKKLGEKKVKELTAEGLGDFFGGLFGGGKKAEPASPPPAPVQNQASPSAPNPDANAEVPKGPEPAPPQPAETQKGPTPTVASQPGTAKTMRNVAASMGQNAADKANGTQDVPVAGNDAAHGQSARPQADPDKPEQVAKADAMAKADAERIPDEVKKAPEPAPEPAPAPAPVGSGRGSSVEAPGARAAAQNQTFKQAFAAARKESGGAGGKFTYQGKEYQTNVKGEKYSSASKLKTTGVYSENFEQFAKRFVQEQNGDKYIKKQELKIVDPDHKDPSSPNRGHVKNEEMASPGLGARHNPKKSAFKTDLHKGSRNWGGNQKRSPATYAEEATQIVKKKVMEKKKEAPLGSTSTGKKGESIDLEPVKPELTGYH